MTDEAECALKSAGKIPRHYIPKWKYEKEPSPTWQTFARVQALKLMEVAGTCARATSTVCCCSLRSPMGMRPRVHIAR